MTKVMVFGSFDYLHKGHLYFLKQAASLGKELIVIVARDKTIHEVKKQKPMFCEQARLRELKKIKGVTRVALGSLTYHKHHVIEKYKPDIICIGYDQRFFIHDLQDFIKNKRLKTKIIKLKAYKPRIYKSSRLKLRSEK